MVENNQVSKSNKAKLFILTMLILLVSVAGISYAYFTIQITGNDTASSMRLRTANMQLVYNDVQIVSGEYAIPGWSDDKTLTVTNTGNVTAYYTIIWRDLINEVTNNELVIYAECSASIGSCDSIARTEVPTKTTEAHNVKVKRNIEIAPGVTHTYALTAEFIETGSNQNYNQNKYFNGTLNIAEGSAPATLSLQTDNGTTGLSTGDVVRATKTGIDNQDFYVVSTNASETVLLAKYNLYVGRIYNTSGGTYTEIQSSASGYGLQSSSAKGYVSDDSQYIGVVPFCGSSNDYGYWDPSNSGINSKYGTYTNQANNIYDTDYVTVPNYSVAFYSNAGNANYSIAYYVEEYVNKLGIDGTGRLLTYTEANALGCSSSSYTCSSAPSWLNNGTTYWLGSTSSYDDVWFVDSVGYLGVNYFDYVNYFGVRPVIVVDTSDIQSS